VTSHATPERLRVLVYTSLFPNSINPLLGNFILERMRHLLRFVDISVVAPVPYFPQWIGFNHPWLNWSRVPRFENFGGFDTQHPRYVVIPKVGMATHGVSMFAGSFRQVFKRVNESDYDLIDAHYVYPDGFAAAMMAGILKKPLVVSARGSDINLFSQFTVIRPFIRHVLLRANGLIAVSQALKDGMVRLGCRNENLAVIGNGVDPEKFKPQPQIAMRQILGLPEHRRIVLSVGRLDANKGFHVLIEAFARLKASERNAMLVIIGEGPHRSRLESQIRDSGLQNDVRLIGTVPNEQLSSWYNAADVFCLASSLEGCPNVVLEAMACGRPVVATPVGGIPDLVVSPALGTLVERDPKAFESALLEAFRRQWNHDAIAAHARSHAWEKVSAQVLDVYSRAMAQFYSRT
jgi:glycosyltransferase involved in cell wall biosynthesis